MALERNRPAWEGSTRRDRLPADWPKHRAEADRLNPDRICHWCGQPAGSELDHIKRGDDICQQPRLHAAGCQCNLDWIHGRRDYAAGLSKQNCHGQKTGREGAAGRRRPTPAPVHASLR